MNQQPPEVRSDLSAQQRGLEVYSALRDGPKRVHDLAAILGIPERGVYRILENISYKYPVTNSGGYWFLLSTEEQRQAHHILHTLRRELEAKEGQAELLKQTLQQAMGDAARAVFASGEVTYRRAKDGSHLDTQRLTTDHAALVAAYTLPKPGARRFVIVD